MKTILDNEGNQRAFNACARDRRYASFSVYAYMPESAYKVVHPDAGKRYSYGPAFYVQRSDDKLPKPNNPRARVRIRVYPKAKAIIAYRPGSGHQRHLAYMDRP